MPREFSLRSWTHPDVKLSARFYADVARIMAGDIVLESHRVAAQTIVVDEVVWPLYVVVSQTPEVVAAAIAFDQGAIDSNAIHERLHPHMQFIWDAVLRGDAAAVWAACHPVTLAMRGPLYAVVAARVGPPLVHAGRGAGTGVLAAWFPAASHCTDCVRLAAEAAARHIRFNHHTMYVAWDPAVPNAPGELVTALRRRTGAPQVTVLCVHAPLGADTRQMDAVVQLARIVNPTFVRFVRPIQLSQKQLVELLRGDGVTQLTVLRGLRLPATKAAAQRAWDTLCATESPVAVLDVVASLGALPVAPTAVPRVCVRIHFEGAPPSVTDHDTVAADVVRMVGRAHNAWLTFGVGVPPDLDQALRRQQRWPNDNGQVVHVVFNGVGPDAVNQQRQHAIARGYDPGFGMLRDYAEVVAAGLAWAAWPPDDPIPPLPERRFDIHRLSDAKRKAKPPLAFAHHWACDGRAMAPAFVAADVHADARRFAWDVVLPVLMAVAVGDPPPDLPVGYHFAALDAGAGATIVLLVVDADAGAHTSAWYMGPGTVGHQLPAQVLGHTLEFLRAGSVPYATRCAALDTVNQECHWKWFHIGTPQPPQHSRLLGYYATGEVCAVVVYHGNQTVVEPPASVEPMLQTMVDSLCASIPEETTTLLLAAEGAAPDDLVSECIAALLLGARDWVRIQVSGAAAVRAVTRVMTEKGPQWPSARLQAVEIVGSSVVDAQLFERHLAHLRVLRGATPPPPQAAADASAFWRSVRNRPLLTVLDAPAPRTPSPLGATTVAKHDDATTSWLDTVARLSVTALWNAPMYARRLWLNMATTLRYTAEAALVGDSLASDVWPGVATLVVCVVVESTDAAATASIVDRLRKGLETLAKGELAEPGVVVVLCERPDAVEVVATSIGRHALVEHGPGHRGIAAGTLALTRFPEFTVDPPMRVALATTRKATTTQRSQTRTTTSRGRGNRGKQMPVVQAVGETRRDELETRRINVKAMLDFIHDGDEPQKEPPRGSDGSKHHKRGGKPSGGGKGKRVVANAPKPVPTAEEPTGQTAAVHQATNGNKKNDDNPPKKPKFAWIDETTSSNTDWETVPHSQSDGCQRIQAVLNAAWDACQDPDPESQYNQTIRSSQSGTDTSGGDRIVLDRLRACHLKIHESLRDRGFLNAVNYDDVANVLLDGDATPWRLDVLAREATECVWNDPEGLAVAHKRLREDQTERSLAATQQDKERRCKVPERGDVPWCQVLTCDRDATRGVTVQGVRFCWNHRGYALIHMLRHVCAACRLFTVLAFKRLDAAHAQHVVRHVGVSRRDTVTLDGEKLRVELKRHCSRKYRRDDQMALMMQHWGEQPFGSWVYTNQDGAVTAWFRSSIRGPPHDCGRTAPDAHAGAGGGGGMAGGRPGTRRAASRRAPASTDKDRVLRIMHALGGDVFPTTSDVKDGDGSPPSPLPCTPQATIPW